MTYVYKCKHCESTFEVSGGFDIILQKHQCPECKSKDTVKTITVPFVHYKGTGWASKDNDRIE